MREPTPRRTMSKTKQLQLLPSPGPMQALDAGQHKIVVQVLARLLLEAAGAAVPKRQVRDDRA